ncbi:MAG: hypothetical protein L0Z50_07345 [Verrucomicrobiales bacterium]|nr:hypothetical protein [Verrucomicrobiales bacterium]
MVFAGWYNGTTDPAGYWEGVAFVGPGSPWYKEYQQITVDFGMLQAFHQVEVWDGMGGPNFWYHSQNKKVEYWDDGHWNEIIGGVWTTEAVSYYENPVIYTFPAVVGSKVRFSAQPTDWSWIHEFGVLGQPVPDSSSSSLLTLSFSVVALIGCDWMRRRKSHSQGAQNF